MNEIKLLAADLPSGSQGRFICPCCRGGLRHEHSLSVWRNEYGELSWLCWRDSCQEHSSRVLKGVLSTKKHGFDQRKKYFYKTERLPESVVQSVCSAVLCNAVNALHTCICKKSYPQDNSSCNTAMLMHANGWVYCKSRHALVMPVLNYQAKPKGLCVRFLEPDAKQKYDLQLDSDWYKLHYPVYNQRHKKTKQVVLVEDTISAARVSLKTPAVALLGTYLSEEAALDLRQHYDKLVVCLDKDTWNKPVATGVKLKREYDILFNSIKVKHISKDPKYMADEELTKQILLA